MKSSKSVASVVRQNTSDQEMRSIRAQFVHIAGQVQDPEPDTSPIPLHVFRLLNPVETLRFYQEMIRGLSSDLKDKQIAVDGIASRGCYNEKGKSLLHLVPAYETEIWNFNYRVKNLFEILIWYGSFFLLIYPNYLKHRY